MARQAPLNRFRNIGIIAHIDAGKTTTTERILFYTGVSYKIGEVHEGTATMDWMEQEQERGITITSAATTCFWKRNGDEYRINIIDTPGFDDFVGEVIASLKVADTALILVNASAGVEVGTELVWEYVEKYQTPTLFVINQIDHPKADFEASLEQIKNRFGAKALPIQYPLNSGEGFNQIIDALRMVMYEFPATGGKPEKKPIPESELARANELHNALVEIAAENEEGLMEKYFEKGN